MRFSLRSIVIIVIGLMGLLGLTLALITGSLYRNLALEEHRESLSRLIQLKVDDLLAGLGDTTTDLGMSLQVDPALRAAYRENDIEELVTLLNNQFNQYFVTAGVLRLQKLAIFDRDLRPLAASSRTDGRIPLAGEIVCPDLVATARLRTGSQRTKVLHEICVRDAHPHHATLLPIGSLKPVGYLQVIVSPIEALQHIRAALGMPMRLTGSDGETLFQSEDWPLDPGNSANLMAEYALPAADNQTALTVTLASDLSDVSEKLAATRQRVVITASLTVLLAALLTLLILSQTTLNPIAALTGQLRRVRDNPRHLRGQVEVGGTTEIRELAGDFNIMLDELHRLYGSLKSMAFRDQLTQLPNRNLFHDYLDLLVDNLQRYGRRFALILMDLDRFKLVNDTLGHHAGDELLQQVSERFRQVLRNTDLVAQLDPTILSDLDGELVARIGGDEFAILLPELNNRDDAESVAKKLTQTMEEDFRIQGKRFSIGVSIGIALAPEHGTGKKDLMRVADVAMYHAKAHRTGFAFYDPDLEPEYQSGADNTPGTDGISSKPSQAT